MRPVRVGIWRDSFCPFVLKGLAGRRLFLVYTNHRNYFFFVQESNSEAAIRGANKALPPLD